MAQWGEMLRLDLVQGRLSQLYERKFPRHIRHCLSFCIETSSAVLYMLFRRLTQLCSVSQRHFQDEPQNLARILSGLLCCCFFLCIFNVCHVFCVFYLQMVLVEILNILKQAEQIVAVLTDVELPEWKRRQQKACVGGPVDTSLDHLQKWFTTVAEVLLQVRQLLQKLQEQSKKYNSADASGLPGEPETFALSLLTKLLANALVVEKQPVMPSIPQRPLILKTSVRFTAAVRFLANLPEFKCLLKVKPRICLLLRTYHVRCYDIGGSSRKMVERQLTECLFLLLAQASSLPVVVVSSTNQIPSAWAALMWCSMLSSSEPRNLLLFADPPPLSWQQLSQVLSWQFLSVGQRGLNENQLSMLRDKIVGDFFSDDPNGLIHWSQFKVCSESAWIWIEGILDLIKRHLVDLWRDGCIMGFVSRKTTQVLLREKVTGTFLLRFSESNKEGAITFSWVEHLNGEAHVHAVDPYTKKDLLALSLPDIIYLYSLRAQGNVTRNPLLYLYPDIHRDAAFGRYFNSAPKTDVSGYIDRKLVPFSV
uniref:Signal transducer and activator of transcription 1b n=1 Tax=Scophthalmus maximus TaxID=52904 RepID=A0A8D3CR57_SCOMX